MNAIEHEQQSFPLPVKVIAKIISYIFHPLFLPVYVGWFFIYVLRLFPQITDWDQTKLLISFGVNYTLLPLVTILLAKGLGFIDSIFLKTQRDRIIPYVATGVFYFWIWYVFKNQGFPKVVVMFALAIFLSSSMGLLVNSYLKISMHTIAMGVVTMLFLMMGFIFGENLGFYLAIVLLIAGLVATARLVNNDHQPKEVYAGFIIGGLAQLVAYFFV